MAREPITENTLFYGDNLFVLRGHVVDECVDLIYLDPPFNSSRNFNVLFKSEGGVESEAQLRAFEDTWHWSSTANETYQDLVIDSTPEISKMISALHDIIGENQMMAYLVMMAARLVELHRVLKPTGSLYLHCDPTSSSYLKVILDTIFGPVNFRNEIIWKRTGAHSDTKQGNVVHMGRIHDIILFYTKSAVAQRKEIYAPYNDSYLNNSYRHKDPDGRIYRLDNLTGPGGAAKGNPQYEFLGVVRYWRYSKEKMQELYEQGRIVQTKPGGVPAYKRYLDEMRGVPLQDVWDDIPALGAQANERLGYPTQKPLGLLERIIETSSNPGDVILDPFCGCGTAVCAAQQLGCRWIGIDVTHLSIALLKYRLEDMFPDIKYKVKGEPEDVAGAKQLAGEDRYQFQWWALSLVRAKPLGGPEGSKEGKKGSDRGVDGIKNFIDDHTGQGKTVIVQVKSGHVSVRDIRDLRGTIERENAPIGVFITLEPPSDPMLKEALSAGYYQASFADQRYPKIQILTIADLLRNDAQIRMPAEHGTFKQAPQVKKKAVAEQPALFTTDVSLQ